MSSRSKDSRPGVTFNEATGEHRKGADVIPGSLASLDTTLPPTPLKKLLEHDGASVYVFSEDDALVAAIEEAAGEQYPVHVVNEWAALIDLIDAGSCRIVLLDADFSGKGIEKRIEELHSASSTLVVLVASPRDAAQRLIGLLSERSIHRLLIKPAAVGITRLLLESAVSRYLQLRDLALHELEESITVPARPVAESEKSRVPLWVIAVALVSLGAGALIATSIVRMGGPEPDVSIRSAAATTAADARAPVVPASAAAVPTADGGADGGIESGSASTADSTNTVQPGALAEDQAASNAARNAVGPAPTAAAVAPASSSAADSAATPPDSEQGQATASGARAVAAVGADADAGVGAGGQGLDPFAEQLQAAALAVAEGRLAAPAGESALDIYAAIIADAPNHPAAPALLQSTLETVFSQAESALLDGDLDAAREALAGVRRVQPSSGRLSFLDAQLAASAQAAEDAAAAAAAGPSPPVELQSFVALARARLDQGQLLEPVGDSARDYLDRAAAIDAEDASVFFLQADLAAAVLNSARLLLDTGELGRAGALFDTAVELGAQDDDLVLLDLDLTAAQAARRTAELEALLGIVNARLATGALMDPANDSALFHLQALLAEDPTLPGIADALTRLSNLMWANAEQALRVSDWDGAERWLAGLATAEADPSRLDAMRTELAAGRLQVDYLSTPAATGELTVVAAGNLVYPQNAVDSEIEGWVELSYIVDRTGRATNAQVIAAEPEGWFEEAALNTIDGYRYQPFELDGRIYERLVNVRVRFGLQ